MGSPYDETTYPERSARTKGGPKPSLGTKAPATGGLTNSEPAWMPKLAGTRRKVFSTLGRKVKTRMHEDF